MTLIKSGIVTIETINTDGVGVGYDEEQLVKLPYVCEAENVEYEIHNYRGKTNFNLKKIITPSKDRITAPCKYFTKCGGCNLQHLNSEYYNKYKKNLLSAMLNKLGVEDIDPVIISPANSLRRRVNLFFKKDKGKTRCGFYKYRKDEIVDIDECIIAEEEISKLIPSVSGFLNSNFHDGSSGEIHILKSDNGISLSIDYNNKIPLDEVIKRKILSFAKKHSLISIVLKLNGSVYFKYQLEKPYVNFSGEKVSVTPDSFLQAVKESDNLIPEIILNFLKGSKGNVADLFCGYGTYSIPLIKAGYNLNCYEADIRALTNLSESISQNFPKVKIQKRDLYHSPLEDDLSEYESIIINPPRTGAYSQILAIVNNPVVKTIIYVSCSIDSFLRDAIILGQTYVLKKMICVDQFKYTNHIEIVSCFQLKENYKGENNAKI